MACEAGLSVPEALVRALARGQREAACLRSVGPLGRQADAKFAVQRALSGHEQELKRQYDRLNAQQWQDGREVATTPAVLAARRLIAGQQGALRAELQALREGLLAHLHTLATYSDVNAARGRELQAEGSGEQAWERGALALVERKLAERLQLLLAQGPAAALTPLTQELEALNLQRYLPAPWRPPEAAAQRAATTPVRDQAPAPPGAKRARAASPPERPVRQRVGQEAAPPAEAPPGPAGAGAAGLPTGQPTREGASQPADAQHLSGTAPRQEGAGGEGAALLEVVPDSGAGSSLPGAGPEPDGGPVPASQPQSTPSAPGSPRAALCSQDWPPPAPRTQTQRRGEGQLVSQLDSTSPNGRPAPGGRPQAQLRPQEQHSQAQAQPGGLDARRLLLASQRLTPVDGSQPSQRASPRPAAQPQEPPPASCAQQPDLAATAAARVEARPWPRDPRPRDTAAAPLEPSPASQSADAQQAAYQATQSPPDGSQPLHCAGGPDAQADGLRGGSPGGWSDGSHAPAQHGGCAAAGGLSAAEAARSSGGAQLPGRPPSPGAPAAGQRPLPRLAPATQAGYGSLFFHRAMPTPSQRGGSLPVACWWPVGSQEHELNPWEALGSASAPAEAGGGAGSQCGLEGSFLRAAGVHSQ